MEVDMESNTKGFKILSEYTKILLCLLGIFWISPAQSCDEILQRIGLYADNMMKGHIAGGIYCNTGGEGFSGDGFSVRGGIGPEGQKIVLSRTSLSLVHTMDIGVAAYSVDSMGSGLGFELQLRMLIGNVYLGFASVGKEDKALLGLGIGF